MCVCFCTYVDVLVLFIYSSLLQCILCMFVYLLIFMNYMHLCVFVVFSCSSQYVCVCVGGGGGGGVGGDGGGICVCVLLCIQSVHKYISVSL